ncbi:MAG TPA: HAD-IA family hydrolase [Thermodesulfovibrionales bacterium]|nr:HAD-IA family hydrolase [Thermodesulfovibrionales bacterium]
MKHRNDNKTDELRSALWGPDIKSVLLDMDGTLLDKYFDDYFWEHLVPEKYSEKHKMTFGRAKEELMKKYRRHEGTLNWTDIDFWSRELNLDIPALKEQIKHMIEVHPHVEDFLKRLKAHRKKIFLVTNAHIKVLDLKMKKTNIGRYFDTCITSFEIGHPKEDIRFWQKAQDRLRFDKDSSLFIDDTEEILKTARTFGIRYIAYKAGATSKKHPESSKDFLTITYFEELYK